MGCSTVSVLVMLTLGLLAAPFSAAAQPARKVYRIGYLGAESPPTPDVPAIGLASFQQGLRELGYVEGHNLVVEYRWLLDPGEQPGQPPQASASKSASPSAWPTSSASMSRSS
jgi:hypothetical protein